MASRADLLADLEAALPAITRQVTADIRAAVGIYATTPLGPTEHAESVERLVALTVRWLRQSGPSIDSEVLEPYRTLGSRRAMQGVPLGALLESLHIGYGAISSHLLASGEARGEPGLRALASVIDDLVARLRHVVHAVAEAPTMAWLQRREHTAELGRLLLDRLTLGRFDARLAEVATSLGLPPTATYVVAVVTAEPDDVSPPASGPRWLVLRRGDRTVLILQSETDDELAALLASRGLAAGLGGPHSGLSGLSQSLKDAEAAHSCSSAAQRVVSFRRQWWLAAIARHADEVAPYTAPVAEVAGRQEHLSDAVVAYAESGFSLTAAAKALHVTPSTAAYRLRRWRELTGLDPQQLNGLVASVLALRLRSAP